MWKVLNILTKNLIYSIPLFLVAGFVFGISVDQTLVKQLKTLILPLTFLMVYPMMVTLNINHLKKGLNFKVQLAAQIINFGIIPFVAFLLGLLFFKDSPYMALGLLLAALLPTSGMTISWTGFAKGNMGAAINMTVIGLTLGSLLTPFYLSGLMGAQISVELMSVFQQIFLIVFLPMAAGYITRTLLIRRYGMQDFKGRIGVKFPPFSTVGVLGIVFLAMALKARTIMAAPGELVSIVIPLAILYLVNFSLSSLVGKIFFNRGDGIALVYGTVMRNLSIALAIAINVFGEGGTQGALVISLAYIIQVQSAAWYVRFTDRLFGEAGGD